MKTSIVFCHPWIIGMALLLPGAFAAADAPAVNAPQLTQEQALQAAATFCRQIGKPVTVPGTAQYPAPPDDLGADHDQLYWQQRWKVSFPGQAEVQVVDANGIVASYQNSAYSARRDTTPPGTAIPKQDALDRATAALKATGVSEELLFPRADLIQFASPAAATTYEWEVFWERSLQGVPYRYQHVALGMDAQTGEITALFVVFPTPPAQQTPATLVRIRALALARARLAAAGMQHPSLQDVHLEILRTDVWPLRTADKLLRPAVPRLVWVCRFQEAERGQYVFVDAKTGAVTVIGLARETTLPLTQALKHASECFLKVRDDRHDNWTNVPSATISPRLQPHLFALLKQSKWVDASGGPGGIAHVELVIKSPDQTIHEYVCYPEGRLCGAGSYWVRLPAEFSQWVQKEIDDAKHQAAQEIRPN